MEKRGRLPPLEFFMWGKCLLPLEEARWRRGGVNNCYNEANHVLINYLEHFVNLIFIYIELCTSNPD
jgi:hypothetical protein